MTPKKYSQNLHTPISIHFSENPKKYWNAIFQPPPPPPKKKKKKKKKKKNNGPNQRMYENIRVPTLGNNIQPMTYDRHTLKSMFMILSYLHKSKIITMYAFI